MPAKKTDAVQKPTARSLPIVAKRWECPRCGTVRNVGVAICPGCGAWGLYPKVVPKIVKD